MRTQSLYHFQRIQNWGVRTKMFSSELRYASCSQDRTNPCLTSSSPPPSLLLFSSLHIQLQLTEGAADGRALGSALHSYGTCNLAPQTSAGRLSLQLSLLHTRPYGTNELSDQQSHPSVMLLDHKSGSGSPQQSCPPDDLRGITGVLQ